MIPKEFRNFGIPLIRQTHGVGTFHSLQLFCSNLRQKAGSCDLFSLQRRPDRCLLPNWGCPNKGWDPPKWGWLRLASQNTKKKREYPSERETPRLESASAMTLRQEPRLVTFSRDAPERTDQAMGRFPATLELQTARVILAVWAALEKFGL